MAVSDAADFKDALYTCDGKNGAVWEKVLACFLAGFSLFVVLILLYGAGWARTMNNTVPIAYGIFAAILLLCIPLYIAGIKHAKKKKGICFAIFPEHLTIKHNGNLINIKYKDITKYSFAGTPYNYENGDEFTKNLNWGYFYIRANDKTYKSPIGDIATARKYIQQFVSIKEGFY